MRTWWDTFVLTSSSCSLLSASSAWRRISSWIKRAYSKSCSSLQGSQERKFLLTCWTYWYTSAHAFQQCERKTEYMQGMRSCNDFCKRTVLEWRLVAFLRAGWGGGSPTVVWSSVWGGRSAGPTVPLPHPAAFWLHGCHSAQAGFSGYWWYSIARLWGKEEEKRQSVTTVFSVGQ